MLTGLNVIIKCIIINTNVCMKSVTEKKHFLRLQDCDCCLLFGSNNWNGFHRFWSTVWRKFGMTTFAGQFERDNCVFFISRGQTEIYSKTGVFFVVPVFIFVDRLVWLLPYSLADFCACARCAIATTRWFHIMQKMMIILGFYLQDKNNNNNRLIVLIFSPLCIRSFFFSVRIFYEDTKWLRNNINDGLVHRLHLYS